MSALKVMIFESDRAFADSLKRAFTRRGCTVRVVDDGQIGIDLAPTDPPELIIVAVELPRMSGFAVCNKLKKVPELKDVPVVITSSESSQETFDHHSKLRTRAEDYVHKPITPDELIRRCAAHVRIDDDPGGDSEEVDFDDLEAVAIADDPAPTSDAELDNIADVAFDNIMIPSDSPGQPAPTPVKVPTGSTGAAAKANPARGPALVDDDLDDLTMVASSRSIADLQLAMRATPRPQPAATGRPASDAFLASAPSAAPPASSAEVDRLTSRVAELESQLSSARGEAAERESLAAENARLKSLAEDVPRLRAQADEVPRLRAQADEATRLQRELEDLRARTARPPSATTTATSREGLELRETLHRKDKELLQLREVANARDKELLQLRETLLQRDLEKADLDERVLEREREKADLDERHAALTQDHEALTAAAAATRAELEQAKKQASAAAEQAAAAAAKAATDRDAAARAHENALSGARVEHERAVAALRAEHAKAVAEQEGRFRDAQTAHAKAVADLDARFNEAKAAAEKAAGDAKAAHDKALADAKAAHDKALADAKDAHERAQSQEKAAHDKAIADARFASEKAAGEAKAAHDKALADAQAAHTRELEALRETGAAAALAAAAAAAAALAKYESDTKALRDANAAATTKHEADLKALRDANAAATASATRSHGELEGRFRAMTGERDKAAQRGDQLAQELAQTRGELERARALASRNAALLERARRAALIAAGLVEETARPLDEGGSASAGNAE
jgi:CheY-like chemotaxis protein